VNLQQKHNFSMAHFGMVLGMLRRSLAELAIQHCNDFFSLGAGALSAISCLPALRALRIEDLHCRVDRDALAELARLTQVRCARCMHACAGGWQGCMPRVPCCASDCGVFRWVRGSQLPGQLPFGHPSGLHATPSPARCIAVNLDQAPPPLAISTVWDYWSASLAMQC
jgi:hypothetical protein